MLIYKVPDYTVAICLWYNLIWYQMVYISSITISDIYKLSFKDKAIEVTYMIKINLQNIVVIT